jgi:hypothetical protein
MLPGMTTPGDRSVTGISEHSRVSEFARCEGGVPSIRIIDGQIVQGMYNMYNTYNMYNLYNMYVHVFVCVSNI